MAIPESVSPDFTVYDPVGALLWVLELEDVLEVELVEVGLVDGALPPL